MLLIFTYLGQWPFNPSGSPGFRSSRTCVPAERTIYQRNLCKLPWCWSMDWLDKLWWRESALQHAHPRPIIHTVDICGSSLASLCWSGAVSSCRVSPITQWFPCSDYPKSSKHKYDIAFRHPTLTHPNSPLNGPTQPFSEEGTEPIRVVVVVEGILWQSLCGMGREYVGVWDEVEVVIRAGIAMSFICLSHR